MKLTNGYPTYILTTKVYPSYIFLGRKPETMKVSAEEKTIQKKTKRTSEFAAQTVIRRWGNSQGIRLPKELMAQMNLKENDTIGINIHDGKMTIEKIDRPKYLNLQERLEAFYNTPIDEIYVESIQEVEVGDPKGNEFW